MAIKIASQDAHADGTLVVPNKLGIGTTSPVATLHTYGSVRLSQPTGGAAGGSPFDFTQYNDDLYLKMYRPANATQHSVYYMQMGIAGLDGGALIFRRSTAATTIGSETMADVLVMRSNGNVGIGTSSPSTGLHVSTSDGSITANNTGGTDSSFFLHTTGTLKWSITQAPLAGDRLYIRDAQTNDGVYLAQNTTSWTANSDSRLKDVQGTITDALAKVGQLTGVKFTWKRDADNPAAKVRVGLIAQDVQAVLPEAVDDESPDLITDEETGKVSGGLGVRYTELVPLLVNAIKELTARVVTLEQAVA